ncbi:MAG: hypothetical protein H6668_20470 [Ardenticatenaceae bacterium]|nr:hypothetical protein [Ardenticatenaceae bacterium]
MASSLSPWSPSPSFDAINGEFNQRIFVACVYQPIYRDALLLGTLVGLFTLSLC